MKSNSPVISVVMSVVNGGDRLREAIESVLSQTFTDFELIVIDGGSTDDSVENVKSYRDSRIVLRESTQESTISLHIGIALARGRYIAVMDAEGVMLPHRLETQLRFMEENPDIDVCGSWLETLEGGTSETDTRITRTPQGHESIAAGLLVKNCIAHQTAMLRRASLAKLPSFPNIYNPEFIHAEDYKLWTDMAAEGMRFANIQEALAKCRHDENKNSDRYKSYMKEIGRRIRSEYLEFVSEALVQEDDTVFDFVNEAIGRVNEGALMFDTLTQVVRDLYLRHLNEARRAGKIKVLFCINTLAGGGAEKVLIDILKHFEYKRYCVDLLLFHYGGVYLADVPGEVRLISLEDGEYLANARYDAEVAFLEGSAVQYIARRENDAKKIAWVHTDLKNNHWTMLFYEDNMEAEAADLSRMDEIVFVSEDARGQFSSLFPGVEASKTVIYNLIDADEIRRRSNAFQVEKRKLTLCCVGRLSKQKGYPRLISVIERLVHEAGLELDLWILGEGWQMAALEALIKEHSLEDVVFLKGFQKNPHPYLKAADLFLLPSLAEGFPLVLAEALCLDKPVLATECTGTTEMLDNGAYGMLVENDDEAIYQGLRKM